MNLTARWLAGLAGRRPSRLVGPALGVAVAVALLASIGSFVAGAEAGMTGRSVARVAVDWQVQVKPGTDPAAALSAIRAWPRTRVALPVGFAATTGLSDTAGGSTQSTGPGVVVGLPPGYASSFPGEMRPLVGPQEGVLLAQQTAANLHAQPGDLVSIGRQGLAPVTVRVDGVVDLPQADSLFQVVGAPRGSQPLAPPDNVLLLPAARWHRIFDPLALAQGNAVHDQVHVRISHRLPANPVDAYAEVTGAARNLELRLAGAVVVGDNLGAALDAARSDALYAQVLFMFLGLPGAILAALLTASVAAAGADRRRREQALLRTRGAAPGSLVALAFAEAAVVALAGVAAGLGLALLVGRLAFDTVGFGASWASAAVWGGGAALTGLGIAGATVLVPSWRDARRLSVAGARRVEERRRPARWAPYALDLVLLAGAGAVFWQSSQSGYELILVPEGVPQVSLSYWAFAGPVLLWIGAGLLTWHLADHALATGRGVFGRALAPVAGGLAGAVASTLVRQRRLLGRSLAMVALTAAFAASTAIFNSTYEQQARVDALLTNGADVRVDTAPGSSVPASAASRISAVPGVAHVEPLQHRFAYVGNDLQDLYGVRPQTVIGATRLQDAYFSGGSAQQLIAKLAATPDAILVSAETARDFQLNPGDRLTLRLQDRTGRYVPVTFHYAGVVKEFPTAPKDSFLVTNAAYVAQATGSDSVGSFLVDTGGAQPAAVAAGLRRALGGGVKVTDITSSRRVIGSSLTAVDLGGLTRIELGFALLLALAASGLVLALGFIERRRTFAIASALGARPRQLATFVSAEAAFVAAGGIAAGALLGWVVSQMLVAVLTGVFDPAPSSLAVPSGYLAAEVCLTLAGVLLSVVVAVRITRRASVSDLRDL